MAPCNLPWLATAASLLLAIAVPAQNTTGFLYYVGGVANTGSMESRDGTPTLDNAVFGTFVANVVITPDSVSVSSWRRANSLTQTLPEDNDATTTETEAYSWMYLEDSTFAHNGRLYTGPGDWNADSTRTTANLLAWIDIESATGALQGDWNLSDPLPDLFTSPTEQAIGAGEFVDFGGGNAWYYVAGGTSSGSRSVRLTRILADGSPTPWTTTRDIPTGDWFHRATIVGDTFIVTDGNITSGTESYYSTIRTTTGDLISSFTNLGPWAPDNRWGGIMEKAVTPSGDQYAIIAGGNGPSGTIYRSLVTGGIPAPWELSLPLPLAKRQLTSVSHDDVVILLGGADDAGGTNMTDVVQVGRFLDSGFIQWGTSETDSRIEPLPRPVAFGGAAFLPAPLNASATNWEHYQ